MNRVPWNLPVFDLDRGVPILDIDDLVQLDHTWKVSPSQIKMIQRSEDDEEGCDRKWGYRYIEGIESPPSRAAQLGTDTHEQLEGYFRNGEDPDSSIHAGKLAWAALEVYPSIRQLREHSEISGFPHQVESHLAFVSKGILYRGLGDLLWVESHCQADSYGATCGEPILREGLCLSGHKNPKTVITPVVADHKTSSNPAKWGLISAQLATDPQALIYSQFALAWTAADRVELQWTYLRTKNKPLPLPVSATLNKTKIKENFGAHVVPHAKRITEFVRAHERGELLKADQLEANPRACAAFGGCPHAAYCPRSPGEVLTATMGRGTMNLLDKLKKKNKNKSKKQGSLIGEDGILTTPKKRKKDKSEVLGKAPKKRKKDKNKGRTINSPEAPKDPEIARAVSEAVGAVGGGRKEKRENSRKIAEVAATASNPEEARERAKRVLDEVGRAGLSVQEKLLLQLSAGLTIFAPTKSRGAALGLPWAAGRTVNALAKESMIKRTKLEAEDRAGAIYRVELLPAGEARVQAIRGALGDPPRPHTVADTPAVRVTSSQLGTVVENLRVLLESLENLKESL